MELGAIFLSVVQLIVAVLLAAVTAYLGVFIFEKATRGLDEWEELKKSNVAVGLVLGAVIVGVAIILRPTMSVSIIAGQADVGRAYPYYALLIQAVQILIGLILAVASIAVSLCLFTVLTRNIDEMEELKKGNVSMALLLTGVIIAVSFLVTTAVEDIALRIVSGIF